MIRWAPGLLAELPPPNTEHELLREAREPAGDVPEVATALRIVEIAEDVAAIDRRRPNRG